MAIQFYQDKQLLYYTVSIDIETPHERSAICKKIENYWSENLCIWGFTLLSKLYRSYITMGSFVGRGNQFFSWSRLCTVNFRPSVSNYQFFPIRYGV